MVAVDMLSSSSSSSSPSDQSQNANTPETFRLYKDAGREGPSCWFPLTVVVVVDQVLGLSGVEGSPQRLPLQCSLTVLFYVLHQKRRCSLPAVAPQRLNARADGAGRLPSPAPGPVCSLESSSDRRAGCHESECPSGFPLGAPSRPSWL